MAKKTKSNQGRIIGLFILFILVAAIVLTVIVSQQQQETRQHAAELWTPTTPPCFIPAEILSDLKIPKNIISQNYGYGDVDRDGVVTAKDALLILKYVAKTYKLTPLQIETADVDGPKDVLSNRSDVTAADALLIQKFVARIRLTDGRISFPVCPVPPTIPPWSSSPIPAK